MYQPGWNTGLIKVVSPVSGGFAIVQPGSQLSINAVEGYPLEDFSADVSLCSRQDDR